MKYWVGERQGRSLACQDRDSLSKGKGRRGQHTYVRFDTQLIRHVALGDITLLSPPLMPFCV